MRLFVSDIDGCLAEPFQPYDLAVLGRLRAAAGQPGAPALSLLSGRAFPYVEAMAQLLGTTVPVAFESGGGVFDRVAGRVTWNPLFTEEVAAQLAAVKAWMHRDVLGPYGVQYDYGKRTQAGIIGPDEAAVARAADVIKRHVADAYPDLVAYSTPVSVDVLARSITKVQAVAWLAALTGVAPAEMAYIGDTEGDLGALAAVGRSFAPANAAPAVQAAVHRVTTRPLAEGVLEAFAWCAARATPAEAA